jgi:hypothetical protein
MVEFKKGKIVIDVHEYEDTVLTPSGDVKEIKSKGEISVINQSSSHRLWDLKLNIGNKDFSNLKGLYAINSIEPGQKWKLDYSFTNVSQPILKLTEIIDTSAKNEGVNTNFAKAMSDTCSIKIILENSSEKEIQNVVLVKEIPEYLKELKIVYTSDGNPSLNGRRLEWNIATLEPEKVCSIIVEGRTEIMDSAVKSGNPIEVTYESIMALRSKIAPSVEGLTDIMVGQDKEEDSQKPGVWNCNVEFSNESDFELTLKKMSATAKTVTGEETLFEITPNAVIAASKSYVHPFAIDSKSVPNFTPKVDFSANHDVYTIIHGKIVQEAKTFNVIETKTTKIIDPPAVKANANTDMKITVLIDNVGSATLDSLELEDSIPQHFQPPTLDKILFEVAQSASGAQVTVLGSQNVNLSITPDDSDASKCHVIKASLQGLEKWWKPNHAIRLSYPIIARNPLPNTRYETPVDVNSNTNPKGVGYPDKCVEMPVIGIKYVQRKVKAMKAISPAGSEGKFKISLKIINQGGVELEGIKVIEQVPQGFKAMDFSIKPELIENPQGDKLVWTIARINPEETVKIDYLNEGKGEFPRTEPEIVFKEDAELPAPIPKAASGPATVSGAGCAEGVTIKQNVSELSNLLDELKIKLNKIVPCEKAAELIIQTKDSMLALGKSSQIFHEMNSEASQLKKLGEKPLIGEKLAEILTRIGEWQSKLK